MKNHFNLLWSLSFLMCYRYECGIAREFKDPSRKSLYKQRTIECNWNGTWTPVNALDICVWTACLYPPEVYNFSHLSNLCKL